MKVKKKQKEEDDDANDDDNDDVDDDVDDDGGGGDGDDDVYRLTVIDVRVKGLLVSFLETIHIHPIWAPGELESAVPPRMPRVMHAKASTSSAAPKKKEKRRRAWIGDRIAGEQKGRKR